MSAPAEAFAEALGHRFRDPELLERALTHPSAAHEIDGGFGNERLEYLGDAVLDLVVAELLFAAHPGWREGELTRARAALVNTRSLAAAARRTGLDAHARLGRSERVAAPAARDRVLANVFEAVLGALYLDAGLAAVEAFVRRAFAEGLARPAPERDPKTRFQEWAHANLGATPRYETLADSGVDEDEARFRVCLRAGEREYASATGRTKRAAQRAAAVRALAEVEPEHG